MIPIKLTFEGVYSYRKRHNIDFQKLVDTGLFGIFGKVGSGKSSILEALTFALYGQTERLNARGDNRNYNMMNLRSNESIFDFEFSNFKNEKYRIFRQYRRNSKKFEDVQLRHILLYYWQNEEWIPMESPDSAAIERVVGLSYDNFKRTIIIPQGRFREFIDLPPAQRTTMLKEVFNLHRFDLNRQARDLYNHTNSSLENLKGQLLSVESINPQHIKEKQKKKENNEKVLQGLEQKEEVLDQQVRSLSALLHDIESLKNKKKVFSELAIKKDEINKQVSELEEYEHIERKFKLPFSRIKEKQEQREEAFQKWKNTEKELRVLTEQLKNAQQYFDTYKERFLNLEEENQKLIDYELGLSIQSRNSEIEKLKERIGKGKSEIEKKKHIIKNLENKISVQEANLTKLKENRVDAQELIEVAHWYHIWNNLTQELQQLKTKQASLKKDKESELNFFKENHLSLQDWEEKYKHEVQTLTQNLVLLQEEKSQLALQIKLDEYTRELKMGMPCPLCGSKEHPDVLKTDDITGKADKIDKKIMEAKSAIDNWQNIAQKSTRHSDNYKRAQKELKAIKCEEEDLLEKKEELVKTFIWDKYDKDNPASFTGQQKEAARIEKEITHLEKTIEDTRSTLKENENDLEKFNKAFIKISTKLETSQALQNSDKEKMKIIAWTNIQKHSKDQLTDIYNQLKLEITNIEDKYEKSLQKKQQIEQNIQIKKESVNIYQKQTERHNSDIKIEGEQIKKGMEEFGFSSEESILAILNKNINVTESRKNIEEFLLKYHTLEKQIDELEKKISDHAFDYEEYRRKEYSLKEARKNIQVYREENATLDSDIRRLELEWKRKKELQHEQEKLNQKLKNISMIVNLMRSNGFVNYASGVWLQTLVQIANDRFHRLTKNQLSLQLNTENEFEVIDYLNEGKCRSIKTLSGGQTFQVALSLALALAESVQSMSSAERNFFFIDEGFGTQDPESVDIIFETLNDLRKEGKVVGIISHVEALQEQIPVTLHVTKNLEEGSTIHGPAWE